MSNPAKNDSFYEFLRENELIQKEFIFPEKRRELVELKRQLTFSKLVKQVILPNKQS